MAGVNISLTPTDKVEVRVYEGTPGSGRPFVCIELSSEVQCIPSGYGQDCLTWVRETAEKLTRAGDELARRLGPVASAPQPKTVQETPQREERLNMEALT